MSTAITRGAALGALEAGLEELDVDIERAAPRDLLATVARVLVLYIRWTLARDGVE